MLRLEEAWSAVAGSPPRAICDEEPDGILSFEILDPITVQLATAGARA